MRTVGLAFLLLGVASLAGCAANDGPPAPEPTTTTAATVTWGETTGPTHGPSPTAGPGTTRGGCASLMASTPKPAIVARLERSGNGETVRVIDPEGEQTEYPPDANGCAAVPLAEPGLHVLSGYHSCTERLEFDWDGSTELYEAYIPYDQAACS